jgi:hypothetical protein
MLSSFYTTKFAQTGGSRLHCIFCTAWLCYAELFERFPTFPGWLQLLLQFLPQDHVLCLNRSLVHQALHVPPRQRNPVASSQGSEGDRIFGLHVQAICCQTHGRHHAGTTFHGALPKAPLPAALVRFLTEMLGKYHQVRGKGRLDGQR